MASLKDPQLQEDKRKASTTSSKLSFLFVFVSFFTIKMTKLHLSFVVNYFLSIFKCYPYESLKLTRTPLFHRRKLSVGPVLSQS